MRAGWVTQRGDAVQKGYFRNYCKISGLKNWANKVGDWGCGGKPVCSKSSHSNQERTAWPRLFEVCLGPEPRELALHVFQFKITLNCNQDTWTAFPFGLAFCNFASFSTPDLWWWWWWLLLLFTWVFCCVSASIIGLMQETSKRGNMVT